MNNRSKLLELRDSIDDLDAALIHILAQRFRIVRQIAAVKRQEGCPVLDETRQREHMAELQQLAEASKLEKNFISDLFAFIMQNSVKEQEKQI